MYQTYCMKEYLFNLIKIRQQILLLEHNVDIEFGKNIQTVLIREPGLVLVSWPGSGSYGDSNAKARFSYGNSRNDER